MREVIIKMNCITNAQKKQASKIIRKMAAKKTANQYIIEAFKTAKMPLQASKISQCATNVVLGIPNQGRGVAITGANFCRERFCAVCAWRRQAKYISQMIPVFEQIKGKYTTLFITLSLKNPEYSGLKSAVETLSNSWTKLIKRNLFKGMTGYMRSIELTYHQTTAHPHIHAIVMFPKNYSIRYFISHSKLMDEWQAVTGVKYKPSVYIEFVTEDTIEKTHCIEVIKYSLQPPKYINSECIANIYYSLYGKRLISFGGILKDLRGADNELSDDMPTQEQMTVSDYTLILFRFDVNGGFYKYDTAIDRAENERMMSSAYKTIDS